ncbi:unnamed protein product [Amoebophrya sp. A120]|nr:unnamed protein product [Amoebophrya sp. A120]|eukprot:GSA120T00005606001.1
MFAPPLRFTTTRDPPGTSTHISHLQRQYEKLESKMKSLREQQKKRKLVRGMISGLGNDRPVTIDPVFEECRRKRLQWTVESKENDNNESQSLFAHDHQGYINAQQQPSGLNVSSLFGINKSRISTKGDQGMNLSPGSARNSKDSKTSTTRHMKRKLSSNTSRSFQQVREHSQVLEINAAGSSSGDEEAAAGTGRGVQAERQQQLHPDATGNSSVQTRSQGYDEQEEAAGLKTARRRSRSPSRPSGDLLLQQNNNLPEAGGTNANHATTARRRHSGNNIKGGNKPDVVGPSFRQKNQGLERRILLTTAAELSRERNEVVRETADCIKQVVDNTYSVKQNLEERTEQYLKKVVNQWPVWYEQVQQVRESVLHEGERLSTLKWNAEHCQEIAAVQRGLEEFRRQIAAEVARTNVEDLEDPALEETTDHEDKRGHDLDMSKQENRAAGDPDSIADHASPALGGGGTSAESKGKSSKAHGRRPDGAAAQLRKPPASFTNTAKTNAGDDKHQWLADYFEKFTRPLAASSSAGETSVPRDEAAKAEARRLRDGLRAMYQRLQQLEAPLSEEEKLVAQKAHAAARAGTVFPEGEEQFHAPVVFRGQDLHAGRAGVQSAPVQSLVSNFIQEEADALGLSPEVARDHLRKDLQGSNARFAAAGGKNDLLRSTPSLIDPTPLSMKQKASPSILMASNNGGLQPVPGDHSSRQYTQAQVRTQQMLPAHINRASMDQVVIEPPEQDRSYLHPTPQREHKPGNFLTPDLGRRGENLVEALSSARTQDSDASQDLLSIAHDYQKSRNASEVPAHSSPRDSGIPTGGQSSHSSSKDLPVRFADLQQGLAQQGPHQLQQQQVLATSEQNTSGSKSRSSDSHLDALHRGLMGGATGESILIGHRQSVNAAGAGSAASNTLQPEINSRILVNNVFQHDYEESKDDASSRANISSIVAEGSAVYNKQSLDFQKSVMIADQEILDDSSDDGGVFGGGSSSQSKDRVNYPPGGGQGTEDINAHILGSDESSNRESTSPKQSEATIRQPNLMTARDSTPGTLNQTSQSIIEQQVLARSAERDEQRFVSQLPAVSSKTGTSKTSSASSEPVVREVGQRQQLQTLDANTAANAVTSSSQSQSHATSNSQTYFVTPKTINTSTSSSSKYGGSAAIQKISSSNASDRRSRAGDFSVSNSLRRQVSSDLSVKLFCFAFLAELVEDQLQDVADLRSYLGKEVFGQQLGRRETYDLDFIFRFLLDIQDHAEETIEEFFEADNLAVEHIHAALFLVPEDANPQFQKVMKEHCAFLEARRGKQILEQNCEWYQKRSQLGSSAPGSKQSVSSGGPAGGAGGNTGSKSRPLQLNPAFLGTSVVAVEESEFAEISDL